jgi:putative DNA primase/helicase
MRKETKPFEAPRTDTGNAELLAVLYGDVLRYDHKQSRWLIWNKRRLRWIEDKTDSVRGYAVNTARRRRTLAARMADKGKSKQEIKWSFDSEQKPRIDAALDIARSLTPISDAGDGWDASPWLFGVANGLVDLRTGKLREERPDDRVTKHSQVSSILDARCPRFERFLSEIFNGDTALVEYAQRMVGYCLTGSVEEQCVFCWYGSGANGKTTLSLVLRHLLGDYAVNLPFSALEMKNRNSNDLVALAGARLATAAETNEGVRLNEARMKVLTGGDPITARRLYHEAFTFDPTHKLVLAFNHKPIIADDSEGMWRRVRLIPFTRRFRAEEQDKNLPDSLKDEAPGILAWAVRGCLLWRRLGLEETPAVTEATASYREESDHVGEFVEDRCVVEPGATVTSGLLWQEYKRWAFASEEVPLSRQTLAKRLEKRGFRSDRTGHGGIRTWTGIRLHETAVLELQTDLPLGVTVTQGDAVSDNSPTSADMEKFSESASPCVTTSPFH